MGHLLVLHKNWAELFFKSNRNIFVKDIKFYLEILRRHFLTDRSWSASTSGDIGGSAYQTGWQKFDSSWDFRSIRCTSCKDSAVNTLLSEEARPFPLKMRLRFTFHARKNSSEISNWKTSNFSKGPLPEGSPKLKIMHDLCSTRQCWRRSALCWSANGCYIRPAKFKSWTWTRVPNLIKFSIVQTLLKRFSLLNGSPASFVLSYLLILFASY